MGLARRWASGSVSRSWPPPLTASRGHPRTADGHPGRPRRRRPGPGGHQPPDRRQPGPWSGSGGEQLVDGKTGSYAGWNRAFLDLAAIIRSGCRAIAASLQKDIDRAIREARKTASLAATLADKLAFQRTIMNLKARRGKKRRDLFDAQEDIDRQRDGLIGRIEAQLSQRKIVSLVFLFRWTLV